MVGVGWRTELAGDLLACPQAADLVEVVAETCHSQGAARREAQAIAEIWPVALHGVKLSLGSAEGLALDRARALGRLARELRAAFVSEHASFTRAGGCEIGHLTAVPFTREMVRVIAANVDRLRRVLPDVPFLLENVAWTFRWPEDAMGEGDFHAELTEATGCPLLLDLGNLHANALNSGTASEALLETYPLERVGMVHLAGGAMDHGFYADTHAHAVPDDVFSLLERLVQRRGRVPVVLERDGGFAGLAPLADEMARARGILQRAGERPADRWAARVPPAAGATALAARQHRLAERLTAGEAPADCEGFVPADIVRARRLLHWKRVDDALPLLPHCAAAAGDLRSLAARALRGTVRARHAAGIADARRIAEAASSVPAVAAAARLDALDLRARFDAANRRRVLPFLGSADLPDGRRLWALKMPGAEAPVRLYEQPPFPRLSWPTT